MLLSCTFYRNIKGSGVFCSLLDSSYFIGDNISADFKKDEITPLLKANDRLKFDQDVAFYCVIEKGKPR